jgi:CDGSH-type Zn-finger protein
MEDEEVAGGPMIEVKKNGPYLVSGRVPLAKEIIIRNEENIPVGWRKGKEFLIQDDYALCRCGKSDDKPFCDGNHLKIRFDGTETASMKLHHDQAEAIKGAELDMRDARVYCAGLQFCHRAGGIWDLVQKAENPEDVRAAIEIAGDCASGRLVVCEKESSGSIEPGLEKEIGVIEDPGRGISGPLWVKGGIPVVSANGVEYERRNRITLCRCGKSENKPFCDGTHISIRFRDKSK